MEAGTSIWYAGVKLNVKEKWSLWKLNDLHRVLEMSEGPVCENAHHLSKAEDNLHDVKKKKKKTTHSSNLTAQNAPQDTFTGRRISVFRLNHRRIN